MKQIILGCLMIVALGCVSAPQETSIENEQNREPAQVTGTVGRKSDDNQYTELNLGQAQRILKLLRAAKPYDVAFYIEDIPRMGGGSDEETDKNKPFFVDITDMQFILIKLDMDDSFFSFTKKKQKYEIDIVSKRNNKRFTLSKEQYFILVPDLNKYVNILSLTKKEADDEDTCNYYLSMENNELKQNFIGRMTPHIPRSR